MTKEEAIEKAIDFVRANELEVGAIGDVRYLSTEYLDKLAEQYPPAPDILETHNSVRKQFRNHWVVNFEMPKVRGQVDSPGSEMICVYDSGEVVLFPSL